MYKTNSLHTSNLAASLIYDYHELSEYPLVSGFSAVVTQEFESFGLIQRSFMHNILDYIYLAGYNTYIIRLEYIILRIYNKII